MFDRTSKIAKLALVKAGLIKSHDVESIYTTAPIDIKAFGSVKNIVVIVLRIKTLLIDS